MFVRWNSHLTPDMKQLDRALGKPPEAQSVGKASAASLQATRAGEQVIVEVESGYVFRAVSCMYGE